MTTETEDPLLDSLANDEDEEFCITDDESPGFFLCGKVDEDPENPGLPADEVPDEMTCDQCLKEERRRESWFYRLRQFCRI